MKINVVACSCISVGGHLSVTASLCWFLSLQVTHELTFSVLICSFILVHDNISESLSDFPQKS